MLLQNLSKGRLGDGQLPGASEPFAFQMYVHTPVPWTIVENIVHRSLWHGLPTRDYKALCLLARLFTNRYRMSGRRSSCTPYSSECSERSKEFMYLQNQVAPARLRSSRFSSLRRRSLGLDPRGGRKRQVHCRGLARDPLSFNAGLVAWIAPARLVRNNMFRVSISCISGSRGVIVVLSRVLSVMSTAKLPPCN